MSAENTSPLRRGQSFEFVGACRAWQWIVDPVTTNAEPTTAKAVDAKAGEDLRPCRYFRHPNRESCLWIVPGKLTAQQ